MDLSFDNSDLENLSRHIKCQTDLPAQVVSVFRRKVQMLLAAPDQSSFKNLKSMQIIPLRGNRNKKYYVDLVDGWDLILSFNGSERVNIIDVYKN